MGVYNGTVPTFLAGELPDADKFLEITNFMTAATAAWTAWTPTLTNMTLGNGTVTALYRRLGKTMDFRFRFILGSTSAVGTSPTFSLPAGISALTTSAVCGDILMQDTGASTRRGQAIVASATTIGIFNFSTTGILQGTTATVPHTWANTDVIDITGYALELA